MKKTQTKAFADLIASVVLVGFEVWAWVLTGKIKTAKNAAVQPWTFPRIMIIGMAIFTIVLLVESVVRLSGSKMETRFAAHSESLNPFKDKGVAAALFVIALCAVYVALFKSFGYVLISFIVCAVIMWLISVRKPSQLIGISLLVPLGMWLLFYKLLKVNIPMGVLQFLRDLADKF